MKKKMAMSMVTRQMKQKYLDNKSNSLKSKLGFDSKTGVQGLKARLITNRLGEDSNLVAVIKEKWCSYTIY